jgi:hypothetical protein
MYVCVCVYVCMCACVCVCVCVRARNDIAPWGPICMPCTPLLGITDAATYKTNALMSVVL